MGTIITAGLILLAQWLLPSKTPEDIVVDITIIYGIIAGLVAYILGRSRRNAFICSVFGLTLASVIQFFISMARGQIVPLSLGRGGAFDSMVLSIVIAVGLCELVGTTAEIIVGKSRKKAFDMETGEFVEIENKNITSGKTNKDEREVHNEKD